MEEDQEEEGEVGRALTRIHSHETLACYWDADFGVVYDAVNLEGWNINCYPFDLADAALDATNVRGAGAARQPLNAAVPL